LGINHIRVYCNAVSVRAAVAMVKKETNNASMNYPQHHISSLSSVSMLVVIRLVAAEHRQSSRFFIRMAQQFDQR